MFSFLQVCISRVLGFISISGLFTDLPRTNWAIAAPNNELIYRMAWWKLYATY
jgi:hypothetical protein